MSEMVQLHCCGCNATLRIPATPQQLVGRKVRCPKCRTKFYVEADMLEPIKGPAVATALADHDSDDDEDWDAAPARPSAHSAKPVSKPPSKGKPSRQAELDDDEEDDLPAAPPIRSSRPKRPVKRVDEDDESPISVKKKVGSAKKKSARHSSQSERPLAVAMALWTLLGCVGGALGAGIWALIGYYTGIELGYLAILVGALVGAGVRLGAAHHEGWFPGLTAVGIALVSIFCGRLLITFTMFGGALRAEATEPKPLTDDDRIAAVADELVVPEFRKEGKPTASTTKISDDWDEDEDIAKKETYHPAVWAEAQQRWDKMSAAERAQIEQVMRDREEGIDRRSIIHRIADQEVGPEFERAGKPVHFDDGGKPELDPYDTGYHPEVWAEAERRWDAKSPDAQQDTINTVRAEHVQNAKTARAFGFVLVLIVTLISFIRPLSILWLILASSTAFRLGSTWAAND